MTRTATGAVLGMCLVAATVALGLGFGSEPDAYGIGQSAPTITAAPAALDHTVAVQLAIGRSARRERWAKQRSAEARRAAAAAAIRAEALAERQAIAAASAATASRSAAPASRSAIGRFEVTCYAIHGTTASGRPTSEDLVAVDPAVIPLGRRIFIDGVGLRTAADTGGSIDGYRIDIWKPTVAECQQFGRRILDVSWA